MSLKAKTQPRKKAKPGRRPARRPQRKLLTWRRARIGGMLFAATAFIGGVSWLSIDGWFTRQADAAAQGFYALSVDAGLGVDDVLVEGRNRTQAERILETLGVQRGFPILAFDPEAAKIKLEALPWVKTAAVERRYPRDVYVRIVERQPLALWQHNGNITVIDQSGDLIPNVQPEGFTGLPLVVGADAPEHTAALLDVVSSEPRLHELVTAAVRVSGRRWNLKLQGGIDVQLPETDAAGAWAQLARIEREQGVLERDVVVIDLRLPDRLVVRTNSKTKPKSKRSAKGEET
ncbi:cell division protein FtsQ/DivIB [Denitrobaculum tricleocarpae]|uniref:Cell division protein FtsQ n=1 Tax=Denitrobaculum tricleocarpae TaxID=2591009 RepID=A0A545T0S5_9PROT|nr:cell division protein FtsQ/DivIB [Denitrobaculum tricleocarpae]TQV70828.1 FtsQ-type POTRA domain-containing protein [Denitrobaculum tricleocarpae]